MVEKWRVDDFDATVERDSGEVQTKERRDHHGSVVAGWQRQPQHHQTRTRRERLLRARRWTSEAADVRLVSCRSARDDEQDG